MPVCIDNPISFRKKLEYNNIKLVQSQEFTCESIFSISFLDEKTT